MTDDWNQGFTHVYTGNGKGKTTAAVGLAVRAAGAGLRVFIGQFIKGAESSEIAALRRLGAGMTLRQFGCGGFIYGKPSDADIRAAVAGLSEAQSVLASGNCELVILDEVNVAVDLGLFPVERVLALIDRKPPHVELVLTGRNAPAPIIAAADLVTEMRELKHYFTAGAPARRGIES